MMTIYAFDPNYQCHAFDPKLPISHFVLNIIFCMHKYLNKHLNYITRNDSNKILDVE